MWLALLFPALAAEPTRLTVEEALARLEAHNPSLARAAAGSAAARAGAVTARSAALPSITATGSYVRNNEEVTLDLAQLFDALAALTGSEPPDTGAVVLQPLDAWTGTATVRVPLLAPSAWVSAAAAGRSVAAADASAEAMRVSLRGAAIQAFWAEASAEAYVAAQQASAERAHALAATAARAAEVGVGTRLSALQAETEAARREGDVLQAMATLEKARISVATLLGEDGAVIVTLPPASEPAPPDGDALVTTALAHRGEVRAAELQLDAARQQLLAARLGVAPTVSGSFSAFASTEPYPTGDKTGWKASVDLTWPLLQGGARAGSEAKARAGVADAEASLEAARLQVSQQVRSAVADLAVAATRVQVTGKQRALAEEAARVAQRSFEEGTADTTVVLDALDRLDLAKTAEIDARARLGMAEAALTAATGESP